jgi:2-keto-3-deoxy-L-rhamnonate aldolase RhmA
MTHLRHLLDEDRPIAGCFVTLMTPGVIEVFGSLRSHGLTWVLIDGQHFPVTREHLAELIRTAEAAGLACLVRVGRDDLLGASLALDLGAQGIVFPVVQTEQQARRLVDACRFPAAGTRSIGGLRNHLRNGLADPEPLVVVNIEDREGLNRLDQIVRVPGVDLVFPGPVDLAKSLGVPEKDPTVAEALLDIERRAANGGVGAMVYCATPAEAREAIKRNVHLLILGTDYGLLRQQASDFLSAAL